MQNYVFKNDQLLVDKITKVVADLPRSMVNLWENYSIILAGGAIRSYFENKNPRDLDFFCLDKKVFDRCRSILLDEGYVKEIQESNFCKYRKDNLEVDISFIYNSKNVFDILETFDFTISKAAYYNNTLILHHKFEEDLKNRKLVYCGSHNPKASWVRQVVFREMGYTIDDENLRLIEIDIGRLSQ